LTRRLGKAATGPSARLWAENGIGAPPVFIVVCNNTATSELVYKHISGFERQHADGNLAEVTFQTRTAYPPFLISADEPAVLRAEKAAQSMGL
jgi:hypothetical protein